MFLDSKMTSNSSVFFTEKLNWKKNPILNTYLRTKCLSNNNSCKIN